MRPALGPKRVIHPTAIRKLGVAKVSTTKDRTSPRKGMSVRDTPHAMGRAMMSDPIEVATESFSVVRSAEYNSGSEKNSR